jgi:hypothetical protein
LETGKPEKMLVEDCEDCDRRDKVEKPTVTSPTSSLVQGDPKRFVPIFYLIKKSIF